MRKIYFLGLLSTCAFTALSQVNPKLQARVDQQAKEIEPKLIEWRRQFHQYPELSNREFKTGAKIAEFLKSLGIAVIYPVAKTGVVGILKGSRPGPVIALRADMDALPITERNDLPFISKERSTVNGLETGVMHACGHDSHMAMLMGVAEILSKNKAELRGTIKFFFQPAEEGLPMEEEGGAALMIKEGVMDNPTVDVVFGLHIRSPIPLGTIAYRPGPLMAAVDGFTIIVRGRGSHGAVPWESVDPIVVAGEIIAGLQTIVSRQTDLTRAPAVITVGTIHAGTQRNIIPEEAKLEGTIRTFEPDMQQKIHDKIRLMATKIAEASGAVAEVTVFRMYPVTFNDPQLTAQMLPALQRAMGSENVKMISPVTIAEDFSFFGKKAPSFFFFLGAALPDSRPGINREHHTADFMIDERAFVYGAQALLNLTLDYMFMTKK